MFQGQVSFQLELFLVQEFACRTEGRLMPLMTSDGHKPYREAILEVYGERYGRRRNILRCGFCFGFDRLYV